MIPDELKSLYNGTRWAIALRGLFALLIGTIILTRPIASVAALALVVALWALIEGVVAIMHAVELRSMVRHWWLLLLSGVVSVLFGVAALRYYPDLSLAFVVLWVSWWLISAGMFAAYVALMERRLGMSWGWTMAWGVLAIIAGATAITNPERTLAWLLGLLAAFGIIGGIMRLVIAFRMHSLPGSAPRYHAEHPARS